MVSHLNWVLSNVFRIVVSKCIIRCTSRNHFNVNIVASFNVTDLVICPRYKYFASVLEKTMKHIQENEMRSFAYLESLISSLQLYDVQYFTICLQQLNDETKGRFWSMTFDAKFLNPVYASLLMVASSYLISTHNSMS